MKKEPTYTLKMHVPRLKLDGREHNETGGA